jgi:hypothetical protein
VGTVRNTCWQIVNGAWSDRCGKRSLLIVAAYTAKGYVSIVVGHWYAEILAAILMLGHVSCAVRMREGLKD